MKKLIYITTLLILKGSLKLNAQVPDTLAYLKGIETNKAKFIGKPFSVLKNSLLVKFSIFFPLADKHFNMYAETSTIFWIKDPVTPTDIATFPAMRVSWKTDLNRHRSDSLWQANDGGRWSPEVDSLYAPAIIEDIAVSGEE